MPMPMNVAVRTDDGLFRDGVAGILRSDTRVTVVDDRDPARFAAPDILLLDSRMPGALALCAQITAGGGPAVVFIAAPESDDWARDALAAGARGILTRTAHAENLITALEIVHSGQMWATRRVMAATIDHLSRAAVVARPARALLDDRLSEREREVLHHAATGLANKELADRLDISEATVKVHLTHIFQKLGVRGRAELVAAYHGVVRPGFERTGTT